MNSKKGGIPQYSAAIAFMLLVVSVFIPVVLLWYAQDATQQDQERDEGDQQPAASAEQIAGIGFRTTCISRGVNDYGGWKKARLSSYSSKQARRLAIQSNFFSATPLFDDRQFERIFRVTLSIV